MPIYEYRCEGCGHQEEFLRKVSEPLIARCPACGKSTFRKLLSAVGFQLKGSGWYATDFKSSGGKPAEKTAQPKAETKAEAKSETKTETKTETKSETKTESKIEAPAATH
jgi:putative FmdB family regulatory protein